MDTVIAARGLTRRFGSFTAVADVSFDVRRGEIFGFLGPNGAGKTTTIRMLTGLLAPSGGSAVVAGHDTAADAPTLRSRIGYMSQSFSLYGDLTVAENIELYAGLYGLDRSQHERRRAWTIGMAGLQGRERTPAADLPLGFKQRLALGCAVLHEPAVLFLDEPTSGVDPLARRAFWELIHAMAEAGTTILVSTHYMEEAEYCHRLILMNRGRIIAEGTPARLRAGMLEPIYEITCADAALAVETLARTDGVADASMFGRNVHAVVPTGDAEWIVGEALRSAGLHVESMRRVEPGLEDVFVAHVRREGGAVVG